jgi:hypothetical protein
MQFGVLQQHDDLAVADVPALDHAQGLVERQRQHLDFLTLIFQPAAGVSFVLVEIFADESPARSLQYSGEDLAGVH